MSSYLPRWKLVIVLAVLVELLSSTGAASTPLPPQKGTDGASPASPPSVSIENSYLKALSSTGGRFLIGTTGGDPNTPNDDNKRLLYGYPSDVGTSFSTVRIINGAATSDYRLGSTSWSSTGIPPVSPPTSSGSKLTSVWNQDGIRIEENLYFAQNPDTGRPDTTAIEYILRNNNSSSRSVGLRIMLDVMVGGNDGAPYFIEGTGRVTQQSEWLGGNVPAYWISYESATFAADSLKGRGQLSGADTTRPDRFVVADWPQAHATVWDYTVNPQDAVTNDSAVILYFNPVTIGPGQTRTYRTYSGIAKTGEPAQVELFSLEATQGIQNLRNGVVLIQDRPTTVRAHVRSTAGEVNDVVGELVGRRAGSQLPGSPLRPSNRGGNIDIRGQPAQPRREQLNDSFYFELPESWRSGSVEIELRLVGRSLTCSEPDSDSNTANDGDCKVLLQFEATPELEVQVVQIEWRDLIGWPVHKPDQEDVEQVVRQLKATFPVPDVKADRSQWRLPWNGRPEYEDNEFDDFDRILNQLTLMRRLDGCITDASPSCGRYYLGLLVDPPWSGVVGVSYVPSDVAVAYLDNENTASHEMGHAAGRLHVNCNGSEDRPDPNYPYPDGRISRDQAGVDAFYGYDVRNRRILGPRTGDLMGYCSPNWPSDYTYTHIRDHLITHYGSASSTTAVAAGENAVIVSGVVLPTAGTGSILSVYAFSSPAAVPIPSLGTYVLRFENSAGQPIASYSFEPDSNSEGGAVKTFSLLLPWNDAVTRIVLIQGAQVLSTRQASAHAPVIDLTYPNGGEYLSGSAANVLWSASDADGDELHYVVQYSSDGGITWRTLTADWTSQSYEIDLNAVAGTNSGLIRVLASDGFHTTRDQSQSAFSVAKHAPLPSVVSPSAVSDLYVGDQTIILEGSAYDNEDRQLQNSAYRWSSSLNGFLGMGKSLAFNSATLAEGNHTITLTVQDSDGQTASASVNVLVVRARPNLPASLSVAPDGLSFKAFQGGAQTDWQALSIRNDGDGALSWTVSGDQPWLRLSSLTGVAPSDILVAADPTGLAPGEYSGSLTITAPVANSPQSVDVRLTIVERHTHALYLPMILNRSGGSGDQFWHIAAGLSGHAVYDLSSADESCNTLLAATDAGVYRSTDGGRSWTWVFAPAAAALAGGPAPAYEGLAQPAAGLATAVAVCPANPDIAYASGWGSGVYRSADGGATWQQRAGGLSDPWIYDLAVAPNNCSVVYAATSSNGVFKTTDGGGWWQNASAGLGNGLMRSLAVAPGNPNRLYMGTTGGVYRSDNAAASWVATGSLPGTSVWGLAIAAGNADLVYAGLDGYGVYRSLNAGGTWSQANNGLGNVKVRALIADPLAASTLYAGRDDGGGVYRSLDSGGSWTAFNNGLGSGNVKALWLDGGSCRRLLAGTTNGAWYYGP